MKLKTVIIGGSNTVMLPGYLPTLLSTMARRGVELDVVADLAVGGTTSALGLYQLKQFEQLEDCELLLIEYAINDAFVYGDERRPFRHWARFYEGIIRYALERNPNLRIATLVFGARNGSFLNSVPSIDAGINYISQWYGTISADVSRMLMQQYGRDVVSNPAFYLDQGHYARPVSTTIVANLIADVLEPALSVPHRPKALPFAIDPDHFANARALSGEQLCKRLGRVPIQYSNRRFSISALDLGSDRMRFEVDNGQLLALGYVCDPRIPPLDVAIGEDVHRAAMMKGGVRDGTYKFLVSMLSFEFLYGAKLLEARGNVSLVMSGAEDGTEYKLHVSKDSIHHEALPEEPVLPITGILFSGNLKTMTLERKAPAIPIIAEAAQ
ncbi:GDSL-like Lipase/Acylhydrolase family protein [Ochrobactrum quorumnocens]|uniref:GDSL-like Lipase/Acylhydrolase family protein n=1 Tax=Ochrobactrum quorumnocens TaxID=271865 RepID=A0A248UD27_9HYPH|nr:SGNH/GDSL hydrolase family protein [[Ochrobactrum] quorumnocens]ASV84598.1 GDSL-like Lipase/Acylhydrolase family protein [[Ochrobactrum] quorumnocens]